MGFLNSIDKVLSFLETAKKDKKEAVQKQAPKAQQQQQKTQQIISDDIKRRREEIRVAREQLNASRDSGRSM